MPPLLEERGHAPFLTCSISNSFSPIIVFVSLLLRIGAG